MKIVKIVKRNRIEYCVEYGIEGERIVDAFDTEAEARKRVREVKLLELTTAGTHLFDSFGAGKVARFILANWEEIQHIFLAKIEVEDGIEEESA